MPASSPRAARLALATAACAACLAVSGCGTFDSATQRIASSITPYKVEVVQGNFVSKEQVEALKPGMGRTQVREILGTPLLASVFHADRWDYVFTLKRQGVPEQQRRLTVFFKGDVFDRVEGDTMPSEAEFVSTLDNKRKGAKVPVLEASEESLKRFGNGHTGSAATAPEPAPSTPTEAASYPPLEPITR